MCINTEYEVVMTMKKFNMNGSVVVKVGSLHFNIIKPSFLFFKHYRTQSFIKRYFAFQDYLTENMTAGIYRIYELI